MQVLHEDDFSQTVIDDGGRVLVVPRGMLNVARGEDVQSPGATEDVQAPGVANLGTSGVPGGALPVPMSAASMSAPEASRPLPQQAPAPQAGTHVMPDGSVMRDEQMPSTAVPPLKTKGDVQKAKEGATGEALTANAVATGAAVQQAEMEARVREEGEREAREQAAEQENAEYLAGKKREAKAMALEQAEKEFQSTKIDEGRLWSDTSTAKKVGWGIAMALSGIGNTLMGKGDAVNPVVGMLNDTINRDVQLQMDQRRHLGEVAARKASQLDRFDNLIKAQQARFHARAAALKERVAQRIETEASKFAGTQRQAAGLAQAAELRQMSAADRQKSLELETQNDFEKTRLKLQRSQIGLGYANLKEGARQFDEKMKREDSQLELDAAKLAQAGNAKQAEATRQLGIPGARTKDGSPLLARTEKEGQELRESRTATHRVVQLADDMEALLKREGGIAGAIKTKEYQQLQALAGALDNELRTANKMGTLDSGSIKMLKVMKGDADVTGVMSYFNDPGAGIRQVRENQLAKYNEMLRSQDENAAVYTIDPPKDTPKTSTEKQLKQIGDDAGTETFTGIPGAQTLSNLYLRGKGGGARVGMLEPGDAPRFADKGLTTAQSTTLDNTWIKARGGEPAAIDLLDRAAAVPGPLGEAAKARLAQLRTKL